MGEAIKSLERKDCPVPSKRLRGNCILGSNFELNSMASSLSLEGSSWRGMLDLDFLAMMWTHHWEVNMFALISEPCGLVASVLVKHSLLFLYLNRWYFQALPLWCWRVWGWVCNWSENLCDGDPVGKGQQFRKRMMCLSSAHARGDAELWQGILHCGILEIPVGKAGCNPQYFLPLVSPFLFVFIREDDQVIFNGAHHDLETKRT